MTHVTEHEIIDRLETSFRLAAEHCEALAVLPQRGPTYKKLIEDLKYCENCCRQIAYYRDDSRWFAVGLYMEEAHKRAGTWLRKIPRTATSNAAHPLFKMLAEKLRDGQRRAHDLATKATGTTGPILPAPIKVDRTDPTMVQVPSGLIVPKEYCIE